MATGWRALRHQLEISGAYVRQALREGGDWESLVPPGVARVIRELERVPV